MEVITALLVATFLAFTFVSYIVAIENGKDIRNRIELIIALIPTGWVFVLIYRKFKELPWK